MFISKFRIISRVSGALTAVLGLLMLASPVAEATPIAWNGSLGPYTVPSTIMCQSLPVWNQLKLLVPTPTIYAPNYTAGWGNDSQPVRYRLAVVDLVTGQRVETAASGVGVAGDNFSPFAGVTPVYLPASRPDGRLASYRVDYQIERLGWDGAVVGWVVDRVANYNYVNANGSQGVFDRCTRVA